MSIKAIMSVNRSSIDLVVLIFSLTVALVIVIAVVGLILVKAFNPTADILAGSEFIGNVVTTIVGALVGFIGGRAAGRFEEAKANGAPAP